MDHPTQAMPEPTPVVRSRYPLAVALANASLLSVGYLMLKRRKLAIFTWLITVVLVAIHVSVARSEWFEMVVLLWWVALVAHGWFLARGHAPRVATGGRLLVALAVTVPVLLAVGLLRFDAARIERTVTEARDSGDCAQALTALDEVWFGHQVTDAPLTVRGEKTVQACQRLRVAKDRLAAGLTADTDALKTGFDDLAAVLAELPGHERMVDVVMDEFLGGLPTRNACHTATITDWLRQRQASNNTLDRSADVVARTAPAALVGCGDEFMAAKNWTNALTRYQQLLDQYPGQELTARAREGVNQATLAIELADVRGLLQGSTGKQPAYCSRPARYSGAAPYGKGTNRAMIYGNDEYTNRLPGEWRTADAAAAVLVICAGEAVFGTPVRTCPYRSTPSRGRITNVTFHRIAIPVRAYELRTGRLVADARVEVGGASCPPVLSYIRYGTLDAGPPPQRYVTASDADVRSAFGALITQ